MNDSNTEFSEKQRRRSRLKFLFIASIFFGPLIAAWVIYFIFPQAATDPNGNNGQLINPAKPLPELQLVTPAGEPKDQRVFEDRRWTFLYFATEACGEVCEKRLYDTRQVRTSLHKRAPRVQRIYIASDARFLPDAEFAKAQHPDLELYVIEDDVLRNFLDQSVDEAGTNGVMYLLDPLGNWVLYYRPKDPAKGMLEDLKRLLKLSQIG